MNFYLVDPKLTVLAVVVILVIIVAVALYIRKRNETTAELRDRFRARYDRAVQRYGSERIRRVGD